MTITIGSTVQIHVVESPERHGKQGTVKAILIYPSGERIGYTVLIDSELYFVKPSQVVELAQNLQ